MFLVNFKRENGVFSCSCKKKYSNPNSFKKHYIRCQKRYNERINLNDEDNDESNFNEENFDEEFFNFSDVEYGNFDHNQSNDNNHQNELIENEFLSKYNLRVNRKYNLLICKTCKYVIDVDYAFSHISKSHRKIVDSANIKAEYKEFFIQELKSIDNLLNQNLNLVSEEIIEGLNIFKGFQCINNECKYLCQSKGALYKHSRENHEGSINYEECLIQTLFLNPEKRKYFRVKKSSNDMIQGREVEECENNQIFGITRTLNSSRVGHQFVSSFETESNWSVIIDKLGAEELAGLVTVEIPTGLERSVNMVFNRGEEFSRVSNHFFSEFIENPFSK